MLGYEFRHKMYPSKLSVDVKNKWWHVKLVWLTSEVVRETTLFEHRHLPEAREEAAAACKQEEREGNHHHVAEVHHRRDKPSYGKFGIEEPGRVHEQVSCTRPCGQECTPPPARENIVRDREEE